MASGPRISGKGGGLLHTRITRMLGIRYPIIQGAMAWITGADMAVAVSEAGGLGTVASAGLGADDLRREIRRVRQLTHRPFAVNIPLRMASSAEAARVVIEEEVPVVVCSAGDPFPWVPRFKGTGRIVLQVVFNGEMAKRAEEAGADALITMGVEAGGNLCPDELTTFVLVPLVAGSTDLPVVAAGGIVDGGGLAAALALGAEGGQVGTMLLAARECPLHSGYKEAVLAARDTDTTVIGRSLGWEFRVLKNELAERVLAMERRNLGDEGLGHLILRALVKAITEGDTRSGAVVMGQAAALVREERSVKELLEGMVWEALERIEELRDRMGSC